MPLIGVLTIGTAAIAEPKDPPDPLAAYRGPNFERCIEASGGVTVDMHNCLAAEYEYQDGILNRVYREKMASLPPPRRLALRDDERAWLKRTKAKCEDSLGEDEQGSIAPLIIDDCWNDATIRRILYLRRYR